LARSVSLNHDILILEYIENDGCASPSAEADIADQLATLHAISNDNFGLGFDTTIGPLPQPNNYKDSWVDFFKDHRLLFMSAYALDKGNLTPSVHEQILTLADDLHNYITEPKQPSLIHGDIWGGNVLYNKGVLAAFIDPAIYFGHFEMEIAYASFFNTFSRNFYDRYNDRHKLDEDFFKIREAVYHLYPLLVHCAIFGEPYISQTQRQLDKIKRLY
ncbi:MAG: fructosamine kinase family protein, partial [Alphaproteobacteria bacterium]|nr:fructosamine kinase family protein [Alphaproteobacteria bacterium]